MSVRHHLTDDLLLAYAAGSLQENWSLAIATHLSLCPVCRHRAAQFAAIGGAALEDFAGVPMSEAALAHCLDRLDEEPAEPFQGKQDHAAHAILPQPLRDYVGGDIDRVRWSLVGGGVHQYILPSRNQGSQARLLRIKPGEAVPEHGHRGLELTLVLAGSFADGSDEFHRGDIAVVDEDVRHTPIAGRGEPCICLAVTDAPLVFRGLLPRIAQRFARI